MMLYEALEKSMNRDHTDELLKDLAEARKKKKKRRPSGTSGSPGASRSSQVLPPSPPPLSTNQEGQSHGSTAPSSSKTDALAKYKAWITTDTRIRLSVSSTPKDLDIDDGMAPDAQAHSSDDEDIRNAYNPTMNLRQDWWKPLEEDRHATPEHAWSIPSSDVPVSKNNWASVLASTYSPLPEDSLLAQTGPAFELVKVFHPNVIRLQYQMEECHKLLTDSVDDSIIRHNVSKPLPLGGLPGQITIQYDFFFNKDLEYLRYDRKGSRPTLSISKMKAAYYPDVGLEQMVLDQKQRFYIDKHTSEGNHRAVRTHMWILSVVRIEVFFMYGYDYMKMMVLRRADLNEHIIAERDFKYLYPSDFEDLYLFNLQGHLNHLPPKDKKILTIVVNLWTRHLVIKQRTKDFQLHDYMVIDSPRAVTFWDIYGVQMIMRFNEIHKFSDDTLHQIDETLDYRVKELKVAACSSLRSLKRTRTIEFRAKRSSKIISLGHYSIMLASSHTVKSKSDIKSPTHYHVVLPEHPSDMQVFIVKMEILLEPTSNKLLIVGVNSLVHSLCTLFTLRRSGLRTASAATKPCQGESSELYLITGRILTVATAGQRDVNSQPHAHSSNSLLMT
uniref:Uncharacterized protein n=1 Tax=Tanacetum cinerariifolium TaxID=118510 RepID=A0A699H1L8_TANCI|nr:hypothetical protein [Tanacetum cinerariifolium]